MLYCQNCGSPVDGRYCAKCGARVATDSAAPPESSTTPPEPPASPLTDNVAGAIAYIPVLGLIFLLIEPYNRNKAVRFHAFQGVIIFATYIIVHIVMSSVAVWGLVFILPLLNLAFVVLWLYLMIRTYQGKRIVLPIIGPIAEKQA